MANRTPPAAILDRGFQLEISIILPKNLPTSVRKFPGRLHPNARQSEIHSTQILRTGVDSKGGIGLCCCLFLLLGKLIPCFCFLCFNVGDVNDLTTLEVGSSVTIVPTSTPLAIADDASRSFINTAKMDRAALNGSLVCLIVGNEIPSCVSSLYVNK